MRPGARGGVDHGSTIPLILGFFLVALLMIGGAIAAADAFVQQRGLQDVCDGAASAAAAEAARLDRDPSLGSGAELAFDGVEDAVARYLARD
ncbi:MAG TPA: pilus assembly protein TadG-related protein, partial [Jatrophihabitantaceae bacterium]|nr:pilus assembly protein TadG-related protein [Jatrophihabitantaceae bacterium]